MKEENNEEILSKLGIDVGSGKLTIDVNKTKDFFSQLQKALQGKAEKIGKDISEGTIDMADSAGIKIDKDHIDIDLNKTKSLIGEMGKKIESFTNELNSSINKIVMNDKKSDQGDSEVISDKNPEQGREGSDKEKDQ